MSNARRIKAGLFAFTVLLTTLTAYGQFDMTLSDKSPSSMYDYRGYLKDKSRSVDGNLSISRMNGNVQYRYEISNFNVNEVPINVSMSYNQNASWTSFVRYDLPCTGKPTWTKKSMNRPVWILGVNGFAVQALASAPRYVARKDIREHNASIGVNSPQTVFTDEDLVWVLDGYDFCNRMQSIDRQGRADIVETNYNEYDKVTDVIRLLREDGSVLELYRSEYVGAPAEIGSTQLPVSNEQAYTGVYVPMEANSMAYAVVTIEPSYLPSTISAVIHQLDLEDPLVSAEQLKYMMPRRVEYFPGDGTSFVFREDIVPFGFAHLTEDLDGDGSKDGQSNNPDCTGPTLIGWRDAAPTIFYLSAIRYNKTDIVSFDYNDSEYYKFSNPYWDPDFGIVVDRGRDFLVGFDNHTLHWGFNSLIVDAGGRRHEFQFGDGLYSGTVPEWVTESKIMPTSSGESAFDAASEYWSWAGLVTKIIDPIGRVTELSYEDYDRVILKSSFPYPTTLPNSQNGNDTELNVSVKTLIEVLQPTARYTIGYRTDPTFELTSTTREGAEIVIYEDAFNTKTLENRPTLVNAEYNTIANLLKKYDRNDIISSDDGTQPLLWTESYNIALTGHTALGNAVQWTSSMNHVDERTAKSRVTTCHTIRFDLPNTYRWQSNHSGDIVNTVVEIEETSSDEITDKVTKVFPSTVNQSQEIEYQSIGNMQHPTYELVQSVVGSQVFDVHRTVFDYTYETESLIPYASPVTTRMTDFATTYGRPIKTRTAERQIKIGTEWVGKTATSDTFLNIGQQTYEARHYTWINRQATYRKFTEIATQNNWTKEERERRWNQTTIDDEWVVFGDPTTTDDDVITMEEQTSAFFQKVYRTALYDRTQQNQLMSWVINEYDLDPTITNPLNESSPDVPNPGYCKLISKTSYGRDLLSPVTTQYDYETTSGQQNGFKSLPVQLIDAYGATTKSWYDGESVENWVNASNQVVAKKVLNKLTSPNEGIDSKYQEVSIDLFSRGSKLWELPTHTEQSVRKYGLVNATPQLSVTKLRSAKAYSPFGEVIASVDANQYLSQFKFDKIGRLTTAWLPHDFPTMNDGYQWLPYDMTEKHREIDAFGIMNRTTTRKRVVCRENCDDNAEVETVTQDPFGIPTWLSISGNDIGAAIGTTATPDCPCYPVNGVESNKSSESTQDIYRGYSEPVYIPYEHSWSKAFAGKIPYKRSEHQVVSSASVKANVQHAYGSGFTFQIEILDVNNQVIYDEEFILDPIGSPGSLIEWTYSQLTIDLSQHLDKLTANPQATTLDERFLTVNINPTSSTTGSIHFSRLWLEMDGTFVQLDDRPDKDFTIAYVHRDGTEQKSVMYAKVDDRSSTNDVDVYPSNHSVSSRHSKALATFTTDGWIKEIRTNYNTDVMSVLNFSGGGLSISSNEYDADGRTTKSVDPRGHETYNGYDGRGRPISVTGEAEQIGWENIAASQELSNATASETLMEYSIGTPADFGITENPTESYGGYCRREITTVLRSGTVESPNYTLVASFYDALNRLRCQVNSYSEDDFANDIANPQNAEVSARNLATWYTYDALGRVVSVRNPGGQIITYSYDEHGRVASTNQVDQGTTSYRYDKLGRLRFSQTEEQAQRRKVTYRQYDDLGRPTLVGEAELFPIQGVTVVEPRLTESLDPEVLHTGIDDLMTANKSILLDPVRPVPSVYHPSLALVDPPVGSPEDLINQIPACPQVIAASLSDRFNPAIPPGNPAQVLSHVATAYQRPMIIAPAAFFENASEYPEFTLQAIWYDEMPPQHGSIWGSMPPASVWDALAPHGTVRNLKGRASVVAYRTHGGQPFHYIVRSYDERGRIEALLRFTENLGFDAVYYRYNSMNAITSIHTVDVTGQHATWYGYDGSGRLDRVWSTRSNVGFDRSMSPEVPALIPFTTAVPDVSVSYDVANAPEVVSYPTAGITTTHTYSGLGTLLRSVTASGNTTVPMLEQRLGYRQDGMITEQYVAADGNWNRDLYQYDNANRLQLWERTNLQGPVRQEVYLYDLVGNRKQLGDPESSQVLADYTLGVAGTNLLTQVEFPNGEDQITYDPDGSMSYRLRDRTEGGLISQRLEQYTWDAFNLIEQFTVRTDAVPVGSGTGCAPDAASMPASVWTYRFSPMQEREQKRQYETSGNMLRDGLAWTYTLLGGDKKQLATYNGVEGEFCGQNAVWMWPVEHNSYGPAQTRIITRPNGFKEFVIPDHLGSSRLTISAEGDVLQRSEYEPFGSSLANEGVGSRTSYIGREEDGESGLGFYGVRLYEPEYGRFTSVDPLWAKYKGFTPYHYGGSSPTVCLDAGGLEIEWVNTHPDDVEKAKAYYDEAIRYFESHGDLESAFMLIDLLVTKDYSVKLEIVDYAIDVRSDYYDLNTGIKWDPHKGLRLESGDIQVPVLGLLHEVAHAIRGALAMKDRRKGVAGKKYRELDYDINKKIPDYDNLEEKRVIDCYETPAAEKTGNPTRTHHGGTPVKVKGPCIPDPESKKLNDPKRK